MILATETAQPLSSLAGLFLWPDEAAVEVQGGAVGARDVGKALHATKGSRHGERRLRGLSVVYVLPSEAEGAWLIGIGTIVGQAHIDRFPGVRDRVIALGGL